MNFLAGEFREILTSTSSKTARRSLTGAALYVMSAERSTRLVWYRLSRDRSRRERFSTIGNFVSRPAISW